MRRKGLVVPGVIALAVILFLSSCQSNPEKRLLTTYFSAISLKDTMTMSTMALEPVSIDFESWEIVSVSVEAVSPFTLAEINKTELDLKKKLEDHVGPVMEAEDALYSAQEEEKLGRTGGARAAAKKKAEEAQVLYDQAREVHRELQRGYNEAKAAAAKEEQSALFSLGERQLLNIRELTGTVHSKEVEISTIGKDGQTKNYRFHLKRYELKDETAGVTRRGAWKIINFEPVA
jgi:hypothetical protein